MRVILASILVCGGLAVALVVVVPGYAEPETCPPVCDQIPDTAWIQQRAVPLNSVYNWPALAGLAVALTGTGPGTAAGPRARFEDLCATPAVPQDARGWAVESRVTVVHPQGQWQLQAQVLHWRGDTARGGAIAASVFSTAVAALRGCQLGSPLQSPSITTDEPNRWPRTGHHAHLPGRARGEQHDQRAHAVVVGAATSALADDDRRSRAGLDDRAAVRGLYRLVSVRRRHPSPVELAPR